MVYADIMTRVEAARFTVAVPKSVLPELDDYAAEHKWSRSTAAAALIEEGLAGRRLPDPAALPGFELPPRPRRAKRLPADFTVTTAMREWAATAAPGVAIDDETEAFRDYWAAAAGRAATKHDWVAAWRNWMRKADTRPAGGQPDWDAKLRAEEGKGNGQD